jgi:phospholipase/carboxylesterase
MTQTLSGPRIEPASGGPAKSLVILSHGYGANGDDLIGLAPYWQQLLPDTAFVSPNAPQPCDMNPGGYQWFPITMRAPGEGWRPPTDEAWQGVKNAAPFLDNFITDQLAHYHLDETKLALVGFSQGTMMSLHVGLRRPIAPAAILGFSGAFVGAEHGAEITAHPPIFLIHGDQDPMIPVQAMFKATEDLSALGVAVQWHVSKGVPHSIGPDGLQLGGQFIADALRGNLASS